MRYFLGWLAVVLWACISIWAGIRFEDVYLGWLGGSVAGDPDHITRMFAIGLLCMPAIVLSWHVRDWKDDETSAQL